MTICAECKHYIENEQECAMFPLEKLPDRVNVVTGRRYSDGWKDLTGQPIYRAHRMCGEVNFGNCQDFEAKPPLKPSIREIIRRIWRATA